MEKKNKILLGVFVLVLGVNLFLFLIPKKSSSVSFDENMFVIADTSLIDHVVFSGSSDYIIQKNDGTWLLNSKDRVDEGLVQLLMSIMQRVRVKRPVSEIPEQVVEVRFGAENEVAFAVGGNATRTKTYFVQNGKSYEVEIPGYRDYLASIFELHPDQWKDRLVLDASWRTIQKLNLDYLGGAQQNLEIVFKDDFFAVKKAHQLDSSYVVDYLNQFQYWQANERISVGRFPRYDTLALSTPLAVLTIDAINYPTAQVFRIFNKLPGEHFHLIINQEGERVIFDQMRVSEILKEPLDFKLSE